MDLPLQSHLEFGFLPHMGTPNEAHESVALAERLGYGSFSVGDHLAFAVPILDPLMQLAAAAALTRKLKLLTGVYLLPLRHPAAVAKQIATLDRLAEGRLILGVGVGGEFPNEFALVGVPVKERGPRLSEGIEVLRKLWSQASLSRAKRPLAFRAGPERLGGFLGLPWPRHGHQWKKEKTASTAAASQSTTRSTQSCRLIPPRPA